MLGVSTGAAAQRDAASADQIISALVDIASHDALMDVPSLASAKRIKCWNGQDPNAPCPYHVVQHSGLTAIAMLYSAILLEEYISDEQRRVLDSYFEKLNTKFIAPLSKDLIRGNGLYEFADYGLGVLAYARWTGNTSLAQAELSARRTAFARKISPDGMIKENSYRGYRGYWYHTLGAENALGYALVARSFGNDFFRDSKVGPRLQILAAQTVNGGRHYDEFLARALSGASDNAIRDEAAHIPHMHQFAVNLPLIIQKEYGRPVPTNHAYHSKGESETISRLIGFNVDCYYESNGLEDLSN